MQDNLKYFKGKFSLKIHTTFVSSDLVNNNIAIINIKISMHKISVCLM